MDGKVYEATIVHDDPPKQIGRTVAIGIDGSDFAQHALEWAVKNILRPDSDYVVLLNVRPYEQDSVAITSFGTVEYMESAYSAEIEKQDKKRSETILKKAVSYLKTCNPKFSVKAIAMIGDAREEIILKTDEIKANIIVVASRGLGAIERYVYRI
jgi:nucleotide-binding universal stress UspA family protein